MTEKQRLLIRIVAAVDAVIAVGILTIGFIRGSDFPIFVPFLLLLAAAGLFIASTRR